MVTTVTLNPMLDKTVTVERLQPGITRASRVEAVVGGKGVNVARQLHRLGCQALATGLWGGEIGLMLDRLLTEEGVPHDFFKVAGLTREGVTYRSAGGEVTSVFEPPHEVTAGEAGAFTRWFVERHLTGADWIACGGSSPGPACDGIYRALVEAATARGAKTVLDTYGEALRLGLDAHPTLIKPNRHELEQTFGIRIQGEGDAAAAVRRLLGLAEHVILTDGAASCLAGSPAGLWRLAPPSLPSAVNPTGSGDCLIAGTLAGLLAGLPFEQAVRYGVAAGAANARVWRVAASSPEDIEELLGRVDVRRLD